MRLWLKKTWWIVWAYLQPSTDEFDMQCIAHRCHRPWVYDSLCMYHNYRYYSKGDF